MLNEDKTLIIQAGSDPEAFGALYDRYFGRVYNYIRCRVDDSAEVDDLTAQVFMRLLAHIGRYSPGRGLFEAWLFSMARSIVADHFRRLRWTAWLPGDAIQRRPSVDPAPEETVIHREWRADLLRALACLGQRERDVVGLKFYSGLNNRQISELTGLSEQNVAVILYRSIRRLRQEMRFEWPGTVSMEIPHE
jgi:RNA polymerase sigma-70 factor (ECF subfamily)